MLAHMHGQVGQDMKQSVSNGKVLRWNALEQEYVIFSPSRADRPHASQAEDPHRDSLGSDRCPFCPGHEEEIPPVRLEMSAGPGHRPWATRVFQNKYPALDERDDLRSVGSDPMTLPGVGLHEVIVETPIHDEDLHEMPVSSVKSVIETYKSRLIDLRHRHPHLYPVLFKNHGRRAGASLRHPHSQLIAVPAPPSRCTRMASHMRAHHESHGSCLLCSMIGAEEEAGSRIIWSDDQALVFVPFAAQVPHEIIIAPRLHSTDVTTTSGEVLTSMAEALTRATFALERALGSIAYNVVTELPAWYLPTNDAAHWSMRIIPRIGVEAGFEYGSGMRINTVWPETSAAMLREALPQTLAA
jgi:UDPglucose--hexose-1-phosphate uridylyltransferase